jgi:glycosyltransferase involved in cell wall biosynthesis
MSRGRPEFSVVIPTRNRQLSARLTVRTVLEALGADAEVVVADNSDTPLTLDFDDPRLKLIRSKTLLAMPDNWESALQAARGEWIVLLSDKCRLVPGALELLRKLAGSRYSAVTYFRSVLVQDLREDQPSQKEMWESSPGILSRPAHSPYSAPIESASVVKSWFNDLMYTGRPPMLYNALVNRRIVDNVIARYGSFFVGVAPDISSSLSILTETAEYLETNVPATILHFPTQQRSDWSNGHAFQVGAETGNRFISEFRGSPFERYRLPKTGNAIVLQTILEYRRLRSEGLPTGTVVGWPNFARAAAGEIEGYPEKSRLRLHRQLLIAINSDSLNGKATLAQIKEIAVHRWPELYKRYSSLRARQRSSSEIEDRAKATDIAVASMMDALAKLSEIVRAERVESLSA